MDYPIVEMFDSCQGEGLYAGTRMFFIRFAGCCVGSPHALRQRGDHTWTQHLCSSWDDRKFYCDTDFKMRKKMTAKEIIMQIPLNVEHICITGGEPLMHDLTEFFEALDAARNELLTVHIETSGTRLWDKPQLDKLLFWLTVSPKRCCLPEMIDRADEVKLLVDPKFKPDNLPKEILRHHLVYIQPVNHMTKINSYNISRCIELQQIFPKWRVSVQLHKILNVR